MAVILYRRDNGVAITFAHAIDAKESMAGGFYSQTAPPVPKKPIVPEKTEVKPIIISPVVDKKPVVVEVESKPTPVKDVVESKPVVKPSPRIIRK